MRNLLGKKFGKLTVTQRLEKSKWKCLCDCGNEVISDEEKLISGDIVGCGCKLTTAADVSFGTRIYTDNKPDFSGLKEYFEDDEPDFSGLKNYFEDDEPDFSGLKSV